MKNQINSEQILGNCQSHFVQPICFRNRYRFTLLTAFHLVVCITIKVKKIKEEIHFFKLVFKNNLK